MSKELLMPALEIKDFVNTKTGEVRKLRYLEGKPRQYRFDAKEGVMYAMFGEDKEPLTKKKEAFSFIPVALRVFEAELFAAQYEGVRTWAEIYFINNGGDLCHFLIHGYSVEELQKLNAQIFYATPADEEPKPINHFIVTLTPEQKENDKGKYCIAYFSIKPADTLIVSEFEAQLKDIKIYRSDILRDTDKNNLVLNAHTLNPLPLAESQPLAVEAEKEVQEDKPDAKASKK
jgi:hypothetical protein